MARRSTDSILGFSVSPDEKAVVLRMVEAGGFQSEANLLRVALWSLGDHMGVDMPEGVFDLRHWGCREGEKRGGGRPTFDSRVPNPKIRQDHPWRKPPHAHNSRYHTSTERRDPLPPDRFAALVSAKNRVAQQSPAVID